MKLEYTINRIVWELCSTKRVKKFKIKLDINQFFFGRTEIYKRQN